jgi:hypothetical protein
LYEPPPSSQEREAKMISNNTYRELAEKRLVDTIYQSIGGSPWTCEFEEGLADFLANFNAAIDTVPEVAEVFDKALTRDVSGYDGIDTTASWESEFAGDDTGAVCCAGSADARIKLNDVGVLERQEK